MPRGRGGKRQGASGQAYSNRKDLTQAPSAKPNQEYGQAAQQKRVQVMAPLPQQAPPPAPGGSAPAVPSPTAGAAPVAPGGLGPLDAPTDRPNEPITAGLATGPGPGPEALGLLGLQPIDQVRAMFVANPSDDLRRLIQFIEGE